MRSGLKASAAFDRTTTGHEVKELKVTLPQVRKVRPHQN